VSGFAPPPEDAPDLRDLIVDALREWRWYRHSDLHRGESPFGVHREDVRLAKLIELIDEHDIAMGVDEPKCSFVKRARMFIDRAERDGLTEEELAKVLAWLGDGSKAP
jgi:hypothetical protein